ncbi:uncharacterized protein EV422DRAFT_601619 [Fimicolochytrium jonesii]|uniref:uncharacterized protein n=1 Tax=Fimicolochytrium jonesii TaxID=1396493 RepID=UPI0022FEB6A6|nr:uncharacterized protein EV422DRAFT_601619 [Fimicolochytrium jonesii]KAI8818772.1 hypothetical protein EV422DRAFT_601619 [Fimicolochytrium jonesii]
MSENEDNTGAHRVPPGPVSDIFASAVTAFNSKGGGAGVNASSHNAPGNVSHVLPTTVDIDNHHPHATDSVSPRVEGFRRNELRKRVRKVLNASSLLKEMKAGRLRRKSNLRTPGAPPGVDVKRPNPTLEAIFKSDAAIRVVDYSASRYVYHDLSRFTLAEFLQSPRPAWVKVRWIDIRGLSYPAIQIVADHYRLHPLAVEDTFHFPQAIKADWYENHIYLSMLLCTVDDGAQDTESVSEDGTDDHYTRRTPLFQNRVEIKVFPGMPPRPNIVTEQVNAFLMRDGTLLSIFQSDGEQATAPLYDRLAEGGTTLRDSEDASFLLFSLMDIITDQFFPILDAYKHQLDLLEASALENPKAEATQELHLIAKELGILRRALMPTRSLVATLRENNKAYYVHSEPVNTAPFVSKLTRTYLADVKDHVGAVVDELDSFENDARHLIDLIFNTVSHSTNEAMRSLAIISLVFLPISFLAGVFGMNFEYFPELHWGMGVYGFWIIVGVMVCLMLMTFKYMGWFGK